MIAFLFGQNDNLPEGSLFELEQRVHPRSTCVKVLWSTLGEQSNVLWKKEGKNLACLIQIRFYITDSLRTDFPARGRASAFVLGGEERLSSFEGESATK